MSIENLSGHKQNTYKCRNDFSISRKHQFPLCATILRIVLGTRNHPHSHTNVPYEIR